LAGAAGTLAMDVLWYVRHRRDGGDASFVGFELSADTTSFEDAGAPAQVGRRLVKSLLGVRLPDRAAAATNNVVHWVTAVQWGALYGVVSRSGGSNLVRGATLGTVAWSTSYVVLPLAGIYKPIWEYDPRTLAQDYSAHLLFGVVTAAVFGALIPRH
jgi:hypothetical protein